MDPYRALHSSGKMDGRGLLRRSICTIATVRFEYEGTAGDEASRHLRAARALVSKV